jgi:hypothetical protein
MDCFHNKYETMAVLAHKVTTYTPTATTNTADVMAADNLLSQEATVAHDHQMRATSNLTVGLNG